MIDQKDFIKINKLLNKRIKKRAMKYKLAHTYKEENTEKEPEPIYLSTQKIRSLKNKLKRLSLRTDELNEAWRRAVAEGDDRETDAISVSLKLIEENIIEINKTEEILNRAVIHNNNINTSSIKIGSKVTLFDKLSRKYLEMIIVDPIEADPLKNKFSFESPFGKEFIDRKVGEEIKFQTPNGRMNIYRVVKIR